MLYKQGEVHYPFYIEPDASITSVSMLVMRDDGFYLDFTDSSFKDSAWVTKQVSLTEKTEGVWIYATGWILPSTNRTYQVLFKDNNGNIYRGETIQVGAAGTGNLDALVSSTAASVWSVASRSLTDKVGYELSATGVDAILDEVVEGTLTMRQMLRIFLSRMAGKASGGGTTSITFRDNADTKNRILMTVDTNGNRSAITLDGV